MLIVCLTSIMFCDASETSMKMSGLQTVGFRMDKSCDREVGFYGELGSSWVWISQLANTIIPFRCRNNRLNRIRLASERGRNSMVGSANGVIAEYKYRLCMYICNPYVCTYTPYTPSTHLSSFPPQRWPHDVF